MTPIELRTARTESAAAARASRAVETIAELSFAILVAGIWFLTCMAS